jgi:hypothetical protein
MPAYYRGTVHEFLVDPDTTVLASLASAYAQDRYAELKTLQIEAWKEQFATLRRELQRVMEQYPSAASWSLLLEFPIPRRMGRIDCVLLVGDAVVVLEFKGETVEASAAVQVEDYALDLAYFHRPSHQKHIFPVVVGGNRVRQRYFSSTPSETVRSVEFVTPEELAAYLKNVAAVHSAAPQIDIDLWNNGEYFPVPTVIEAAVGMFRDMQVDDIAHADADPQNLGKTIDELRSLILSAADSNKKLICFVTGVPGAGKTLAGLKLIHDQAIREATGTELAFLSGNGPLVAVLRAALTLDQRKRRKLGMRAARRDPKTLIQSVYSFKNFMWGRTDAPPERVFVFDEAQRAWDQKTNVKKLKGDKPCEFSEPGLILSILNRREDWTALVCLIGGGQEIHTGEAGLAEWGKALEAQTSPWKIVASTNALRGDDAGTTKLFDTDIPSNLEIIENQHLHLDNPNRQFRGKTIARWAESVLTGDSTGANQALAASPEYPIVLTRQLENGKAWLRKQARGTERFGFMASSGAKRLRAFGITVPGAQEGDVEHWFLAERGDVRSSFQLEVAATEFQVQGLELDWIGVCWGGDFLFNDSGGWRLHEFSGSRWSNVKNPTNRAYLKNTYRVLLTRARQGLLLYLPIGRSTDPTTLALEHDQTAEFLLRCGVRSID